MAIIALVTGILGLISFCFCYGILGIPAVILGILGMKEVRESNGAKTGHGMALAGTITGGAAIALGIAMFVLVVITGVMDASMYDEM